MSGQGWACPFPDFNRYTEKIKNLDGEHWCRFYFSVVDKSGQTGGLSHFNLTIQRLSVSGAGHVPAPAASRLHTWFSLQILNT